MRNAINQWFLRESFPLETAKLELLPEDPNAAQRDLVGQVSKLLRNLQDQMTALQAAAERRRAIESAGTSAPSSGGEQELRQLSRGLLPSLDALDRIVELGEPQALEDESFRNWHGSVKALRTRVTKTLEAIGLQAISTVGSPVDLELHDVVMVVPAKDQQVNIIVSEQQKGYYFRGKLLRDAKVVVAQ